MNYNTVTPQSDAIVISPSDWILSEKVSGTYICKVTTDTAFGSDDIDSGECQIDLENRITVNGSLTSSE